MKFNLIINVDTLQQLSSDRMRTSPFFNGTRGFVTPSSIGLLQHF